VYCPNCGFEYEDGEVYCHDCGEDLVSDKPDSINGEEAIYEDWVELARLTSLQSVEMLLEVLRSKDIPSVVRSGAGYFGLTGQFGPSSYRPVGGAFTLLVPQDFVSDADREGTAILGDEWANSKLVEIVDRDDSG
jgi:hypothetical protein